MNRKALLLPLALLAAGASAQTPAPQQADRMLFNHLELAVNVGTTGIGIEAAMPVTRWARIRLGGDYMPRIQTSLNFGLDTYTTDGISTSGFNRMQELMEQISGFKIDQNVKMNCTPVMSNAKLLVDLMPLRNKRWHLTLGVYYGSATLGRAVNDITEMPSLLGVGMYNRLYEYVMTTDFFETPVYNDVYLDPDVAEQLKEKLDKYGRVGVHLGDFKDGSAYILEPNEEGLLKARVRVNRWKPYFGFGYGSSLKGCPRLRISFDCGVLTYGGTPKVITHDGTDLAGDMSSVRGKVGTYVDFIKTFSVYPVINARFAYTIF
jgi:hypothetical protein